MVLAGAASAPRGRTRRAYRDRGPIKRMTGMTDFGESAFLVIDSYGCIALVVATKDEDLRRAR